MAIHPAPSRKQDTSTDINWHKLYSLLIPIVTAWVFSSHIPIWSQQREEVIAEIVQETITRTLDRYRRGSRGELPPVESLEGISITIARRYYIDTIRRDRRFLHVTDSEPDNCSSRVHLVIQEWVDLAEVASENVYIAALFNILVSEIASFSPKLRTALLIDLASRMSFRGEPTLLQQAFLKAGIELEKYRDLVPTDPVGRSRHASLLSLAYKKISRLASVEEYIKSSV